MARWSVVSSTLTRSIREPSGWQACNHIQPGQSLALHFGSLNLQQHLGSLAPQVGNLNPPLGSLHWYIEYNDV
jgi:hypothetical protein